jgi:anaerobic selenocysteine-containing dehydrogenase
MSNHGRWRTHAQNDDITWTREIPTCKVKGWDGYMYEPVWIHPIDAAKRGIKSGDIVKLYNERGIVLGGAIVWERIIPGVVSQDHGARVDMIAIGPDEYIDRGGANNLISPGNGTSQNCWGMATSGYLVGVEKVTMTQMEEWRNQYPKAFEDEYDPASGLRFNAWVEGSVVE